MLGLLIFSTCRKSFLPSGEQPLLQASFGVNEARNHIKALVRGEVAYDGKPSINKQMQAQGNQTLSLAEIPTIKRGQKIFYPFWDKAITANYKGKADYVEVPIALSHKQIKLYQFAKDQLAAKPDESVVRASFQRLVVFKDRRGRINQRLLTYIPDKDYVRANANKLSTNSLNKLDPQFKGYLEYRNWTGDVVSVLRVEKGKVVRIYKISKKDKKLNTNNKYTKKAISKSSIVTLDDEPSCIWVSTPIYDTECEVIENGDPEADVLNEVECTYGVVGYEEDYVCTWEQNPDPDPCPWGNCDENPEEPCVECEEPEEPEEPEQPDDPCDKVEQLKHNNTFNQKLDSLTLIATSNHETAFTFGTDGYQISTGEVDSPLVELNFTGKLDGYVHTHFGNGYSTFSLDDLLAIAQLENQDRINNINTFTAGVVSDKGTSYLLGIKDVNAWNTFKNGLLNQNTFSNYTNLYVNTFSIYTQIGKSEIEARELAFLNIINNSGLILFKKDVSSWKGIKKGSSIEIISDNCN